MLDKIDRKLLALLQEDCTLSLQALADAVNLTTTPCWKRLKRLEDEGILRGRVALLDAEKVGLGLTAFVLIKTQHHSSDWYCQFVSEVTQMAEVLGFWRMAGEYDYLLRVQVADMKRYDDFYKRLVNSVPGLSDVTSSFAMEQIKYTTRLACRITVLRRNPLQNQDFIACDYLLNSAGTSAGSGAAILAQLPCWSLLPSCSLFRRRWWALWSTA